ncbi:hypothetical protein [Nocardia cerradoensis]|uniref:Uncharacterized protein n=1 Tax=Nocardia cerradoensis TaxID=85688 RepID=A0A231GWB3_9NOCA|nr:hypothetical protein [Nocardia cerradoensis]NKY44818.1 hypothetical protein [Nocardia cerradoensis]OXR40852.1 hypothetical protein B7C42_07136 [Nocardia cerradoensis]
MTNPSVMQGGSEDWNSGATKTAVALGELENQLRTLDATRHGLNTAVQSVHTGNAIDSSLSNVHASGKRLAAELQRILDNLKHRGGSVQVDDLHGAAKVLAADGNDGSLNVTDGSGNYQYAGAPGTDMVSGKIRTSDIL